MRTAGRIIALVAAVASSSEAVAQEGRLVANDQPASELQYEFTQVPGVFELRDGRVVVVDEGDASIGIVDFRTGHLTVLGRHGAGPAEYRMPTVIYPLGGDSLAVLDDADGRLLVIARDGKAGGFLWPRSHQPEAAGIAATTGDGRGFLYGVAPPAKRTSGGELVLTDSAPVLRWPLVGGPVDTVAVIYRPPPHGAVASPYGAIATPGNVPALLTRDRWAVSGDGRVAVMHHDPFQVTFTSASGVRESGPVISYLRQPVTDSVKRAYLSERDISRGLMVNADGSAVPIRRPPSRRIATSWAEEVPPFLPEAFLGFDGNGVLWVQRPTFGREGARYYLIGSDGAVTDRIRFPEGFRVVGFGRNAMYLVRRDLDDLEHLQRRPLPSRPGRRP